MSASAAQEVELDHDPSPWRVTRSEVLLGLLVPVLVLAAVGVAAGAVWAGWADPPHGADLTPANGELLLGEQFGVEVAYFWTGLVGSLVAGGGLAWLLRRTGWLLVAGEALGGAAAAWVSYRLGIVWGPAPDPGTGRGDLLSGGLAVHAPGLFLVWPVGALLAALVVVWLVDRTDAVAAEPALPDLDPPPSG